MTPSMSTCFSVVDREFVVGDGFVAAGAVSSGADALAEGVAVWAVLLAEVALVADRAGVHGCWPGRVLVGSGGARSGRVVGGGRLAGRRRSTSGGGRSG